MQILMQLFLLSFSIKLLVVDFFYIRPDYESGAKVTFTATPAKGWKFVRWQGSGSGSTSPLQLTVNGELNVVAVFEKLYTIKIVYISNGRVEITPLQDYYAPGTVVTLKVIPNAGYKFHKWSSGVPTLDVFENPLELIVNNDIEIKVSINMIPNIGD